MTHDKNWREQASCRDFGPRQHLDPWFSDDPDILRLAEKMCRDCPVRSQCLTAGLDETDGMWGGLVPEERHELKFVMRSMRPDARLRLIDRAATLGPRAVGVTVRRKNRR